MGSWGGKSSSIVSINTKDENNGENMKLIRYDKKNTDNKACHNQEQMILLNLYTINQPTSECGTIMPYNPRIESILSRETTFKANCYLFNLIYENYTTSKKLDEREIGFAGHVLENIIQELDLNSIIVAEIFMIQSRIQFIFETLVKTRRANALNKLLKYFDQDTSRYYINNSNLLLTAVDNGDLEMLKILLNSKPEINKKDKDGHTALHVAAFKWNEDMIKLLIENNADINIKDENQNTVLHIFLTGAYYVSENLIDVIQVKRIMNLLIGNADLYHIKNRMGETLLHEAVTSFQPKIVYLLIKEYGLLPDVQDEQGWSLLHALVFKASNEASEEHLVKRVVETAETLLSFNIKKDICDDSGMTPQQFAEYFGVKYLTYLLKTEGTYIN